MPSILSRNQTMDQQDPMAIANSYAEQIMSSPNPKEKFNQILESNPAMKEKYDLMNQYGNGDPKAAFMNYMAAFGKQSLGQMLMQGLQKLGLS